jgi:hypothetical protein
MTNRVCNQVRNKRLSAGLLAGAFSFFGFQSVQAEVWPHEKTPPVDRKDVPFAQKVDPEVDRKMRSLEWRCVGPFVGVRGCGVEMHPTQKQVFYTTAHEDLWIQGPPASRRLASLFPAKRPARRQCSLNLSNAQIHKS